MKRKNLAPILQALFAAALFGASAPLAKLLLGDTEPVTLAAFLYLGCGFGLLIFHLFQRLVSGQRETETRVKKADLGWLAGAILAGGVAAPIILLFSLRDTPGSTASLLLNFESVATTTIAALAFREHVSRRAWWSILLITAASILLTLNTSGNWGFSLGALGILAACILWGMDNNFTRNLSAKNPVMIAMIKGLVAGSFSLLLAVFLGNKLPRPGVILLAMLLGSLSYGASIVLFIRAMRGLGAARASALFGTAPLAGIGLSFLLLNESPTWLILIAFLLMFAGALFLLNEKHTHKHVHPALIHEHAHHHDDGHHDHADNINHAATRVHAHLHEHTEIEHEHEHMPDVDHRHTHHSG